MKKYFDNNDDHPKFQLLDKNTKFFHNALVQRVQLHVSGEKGDKSEKTIDEICLPKPKMEVKDLYLKDMPVPGMKIPNDDEDWTSGWLERKKLKVQGDLGMIHFQETFFCYQPFFSDRSSLELVLVQGPRHFLCIKNTTTEGIKK